MHVNATAAVALILAAILSGCAGMGGSNDDRPKVVLAIQPTDNVAKIEANAKALERFLEGRTGADIEIYIPLSYSGVVEALRYHHADVAFMSAWPSYMASKLAGAEIVLAEKREVVIGTQTQVQPYYFSYYVVKSDSPYQTLADLAGKRVAYPSETSTSGYVYPLATLLNQSLVTKVAGQAVDPGQFFDEVVFAGGYGQAWAALKNDQVDVTVIAGDVSRQLYFEVLNSTRTIATQGPVPSHGVVFSPDLAGELRDDLKAAFLELKGEHRDLMRSLVSAIFVEFTETTTQTHTATLKTALDQVGLKFEERLG